MMMVREQFERDRLIKTVAALDVGQARDYSVLSILETYETWCTEPFATSHPVRRYYVLAYQERFNGTYPDQVETICRKLEHYAELRAAEPATRPVQKTFVVEVNGIGLSMFQALKRKVPTEWHVSGALLTAGDAITNEKGIWHLNKREIINALTDTLDRKLIRIPDDLPTKDLLLNEAAGFIRTFTPTGKEQLNSDTESRHDDLIISLAYAVWLSVSRGEIRVLPPL